MVKQKSHTGLLEKRIQRARRKERKYSEKEVQELLQFEQWKGGISLRNRVVILLPDGRAEGTGGLSYCKRHSSSYTSKHGKTKRNSQEERMVNQIDWNRRAVYDR